MVFHDLTLERLIEAEGPVAAHEAAALKRLALSRPSAGSMIDLADLLDLVGGRVPLLIEIKSEWDAPDTRYLRAIAETAAAYRGPIALDVVRSSRHDGNTRAGAARSPAASCRDYSPATAGGAVSSGPKRAYSLSHLLESGPAAPDFYAYDVNALPTPVTRFVREVLGPAAVHLDGAHAGAARKAAARWADAPIFEGYEP